MEITLPHHPYQRASIKNTFKTSIPPHPRKTTAGQYYWTVATHRNNPRPVSIATCGSSRAEKSPSFPCLPPPSHAPTSTHQKLQPSNHRAKSQYLGARKQLAIHASTLSFTTRTKVFTTQSQSTFTYGKHGKHGKHGISLPLNLRCSMPPHPVEPDDVESVSGLHRK